MNTSKRMNGKWSLLATIILLYVYENEPLWLRLIYLKKMHSDMKNQKRTDDLSYIDWNFDIVIIN